MIETSAAYKDAIKRGSKQRILIHMGDVVLTNEDISISSGGLKFEDRFNEETELTFGATPSNSISLSLFNSDGFFNEYEFGEMNAAVGVLIQTSRCSRTGSVFAEIGNNGKRFAGQSVPPYLLEDGVACSVQPDFGVKSIVIDNGIVYCFGSSPDEKFAFRIDSWSNIPDWMSLENYNWSEFNSQYTVVSLPEFNRHTKKKISVLIRDHKGIVIHKNIVADFLYENRRNIYEYVKLGRFIAESDGIIRKTVISLSANDQMLLFDDTLIDDVDLAFPITLKDLLKAMCAHVGVHYLDEGFINDDLIVAERPDDFDEATIREVLSWVAEAACAYAKFDRDGNLRIRWFESAETSFDENSFSEFDPMAYQVSSISGLKIRNSNSYVEDTYGSGNTYLIQDNPFLKPDDSENTYSLRRSSSNPILDRISGFDEFYPASGTLFGDFSVESGDVISVQKGGINYRVPIYSSSVDWNGSTMMRVENSGSKVRTVATLKQREDYKSGRNNYNNRNAIGGIGNRTSELEEFKTYAEIQIDEQNAKILLIAGEESFDDIDGSKTIKQAFIDIDGANARIDQKAGVEEVNGLTQRITSAEVSIDGMNANISLKADATIVDELGERVSASEIEIDGLNSEITLKADKITLQGYVTASQLETEFSNFESGISDSLYVSALSANGFECSSFAFKGYGMSLKQHSRMTGGTIKSGYSASYTVYGNDGSAIGKVSVPSDYSFSPKYAEDQVYYMSWE